MLEGTVARGEFQDQVVPHISRPRREILGILAEQGEGVEVSTRELDAAIETAHAGAIDHHLDVLAEWGIVRTRNRPRGAKMAALTSSGARFTHEYAEEFEDKGVKLGDDDWSPPPLPADLRVGELEVETARLVGGRGDDS